MMLVGSLGYRCVEGGGFGLLRAFPERGCVSTFRLRGSESLVGFVLCALNVLWFAALVMSLVWNACSGSIKGWCAGTILDACLGDEERGVGTVEEARALIEQLRGVVAMQGETIEERDAALEEAHAENAELRAPIADRGRRMTRQGSSGSDVGASKRSGSARAGVAEMAI